MSTDTSSTDEWGPYLAEQLRDPQFRAAYRAAEAALDAECARTACVNCGHVGTYHDGGPSCSHGIGGGETCGCTNYGSMRAVDVELEDAEDLVLGAVGSAEACCSRARGCIDFNSLRDDVHRLRGAAEAVGKDARLPPLNAPLVAALVQRLRAPSLERLALCAQAADALEDAERRLAAVRALCNGAEFTLLGTPAEDIAIKVTAIRAALDGPA